MTLRHQLKYQLLQHFYNFRTYCIKVCFLLQYTSSPTSTMMKIIANTMAYLCVVGSILQIPLQNKNAIHYCNFQPMHY